MIIAMDGHDIYLTSEWRVAWRRQVVTPPSGDVGNSKTERQRLLQARKELREESGFDAKMIQKLGKISLTPRIKSTCHVYIAKGLFRSKLPPDEGEYVEIVKMPFKKAFRMLLSGELPTTSHSITGLTMANAKGIR